VREGEHFKGTFPMTYLPPIRPHLLKVPPPLIVLQATGWGHVVLWGTFTIQTIQPQDINHLYLHCAEHVYNHILPHISIILFTDSYMSNLSQCFLPHTLLIYSRQLKMSVINDLSRKKNIKIVLYIPPYSVASAFRW
jgi:hypothetical protein